MSPYTFHEPLAASDPLLAATAAFLRAQAPRAYLVGGWIRDRLLGLLCHDLDFAVDGDALSLARRLADELRGAYVVLDAERGAARVVVSCGGVQTLVDLTRLQGPDILADLAGRDFTVNAMAVEVGELDAPGATLMDPYGGLWDLEAGVLRMVSPTAFQDDPLRILRAVRLAGALGMTVEPGTEQAMATAAPLLTRPSGERVRDELAQILVLPNAGDRLRHLDKVGALTVVFPELEPLRGLAQPPPHYYDALSHSLAAVDALEAVLELHGTRHGVANGGLAGETLAPFLGRLRQHLEIPLVGGRPRMVLLKLAALLHDLGKPATVHTVEDGEAFAGHEALGAALAAGVLERLRFGVREIRLGHAIVTWHNRPSYYKRHPSDPRLDAYRFFRETEEAGIDVLLLSLADHLATRGPNLDREQWRWHLSVVGSLLRAYYEDYDRVVNPPALVDGHLLMSALQLSPGPEVGRLLEAIREAQVVGQITTPEEAVNLARAMIQSQEEESHA